MHAVLHYAAQGCEREANQVPSLSKINVWRDQNLRVVVDRQIKEFVDASTRLTLALDCASYSTFKYSALGLVNQDNEFILLDLVTSRNKSGEDLFNQVVERLHHTGLFDAIVTRVHDILSGSVILVKNATKRFRYGQLCLQS